MSTCAFHFSNCYLASPELFLVGSGLVLMLSLPGFFGDITNYCCMVVLSVGYSSFILTAKRFLSTSLKIREVGTMEKLAWETRSNERSGPSMTNIFSSALVTLKGPSETCGRFCRCSFSPFDTVEDLVEFLDNTVLLA